jgi:hypothetical protein
MRGPSAIDRRAIRRESAQQIRQAEIGPVLSIRRAFGVSAATVAPGAMDFEHRSAKSAMLRAPAAETQIT